MRMEVGVDAVCLWPPPTSCEASAFGTDAVSSLAFMVSSGAASRIVAMSTAIVAFFVGWAIGHTQDKVTELITKKFWARRPHKPFRASKRSFAEECASNLAWGCGGSGASISM